MKTIIFVCHGNICRSVAAEYIAKDYLRKTNRENEFRILSRAVSREEIGNDIYPPMKDELRKLNIPFSRHYATQITSQEFNDADYIFCMDKSNYLNLCRMFPDAFNKDASGLLDILDIEDPWYTGRYELVTMEIYDSIRKLFNSIK